MDDPQPAIAPPVKRVVNVGSRPTQPFNFADTDAIFANLDMRRRSHARVAAIMTALTSGLRRGEVCALRVSDFYALSGGRTLRVETLKKKRKIMRHVPLTEVGAARIAKYIGQEHGERPDKDAPLFRTAGTRYPFTRGPLTPRAVAHVVGVALRCAGIKGRITAHSFRHGFATGLLRKGADLRTVQELMGHENIWSTQRYLHTSQERCAAAVTSLWE